MLNAAVNAVLPKEVMAVTDALRNKILSLIPSSDLKKQISLLDWQFSDKDLLSIAREYAPDYEARIAILQMLEQCFSGELKEYTSRIIHTQNLMLDSFMQPDQDAVYELHIKETPNAYDERYLCRSYQDALRTIQLFYQEYDGQESVSSRYTIVKRLVLSENMKFSEDELGKIVLLPGMKVYSVNLYAYSYLAEECDGMSCMECSRLCARIHRTLFPLFLRHGDAVKYREYDGEEAFGIVLVSESHPCNEYYVIPLNSIAVRYHDYINIYDEHQHIPAPLVSRVSEKDLPEKNREDYKSCLQYIKQNGIT